MATGAVTLVDTLGVLVEALGAALWAKAKAGAIASAPATRRVRGRVVSLATMILFPSFWVVSGVRRHDNGRLDPDSPRRSNGIVMAELRRFRTGSRRVAYRPRRAPLPWCA